MRIYPTFFLCFLLWTLPAQAVETVTIVADTWCPYNCDPQSDRPGYMIEIAKKAFRRHGIAVEYTTMPWKDAIEETRMFKHTAIVGASVTDAPDFIFPKIPQGWMENAFYVSPDNKWYYYGDSSLPKVVLGVVADYTYGEPVDAYIEKNKNNAAVLQIASGDNALEVNVRKLLSGKINAFIEDEHVVAYFLSQRSKSIGAQIKYAGSLPTSDQNTLFIAFSPKAPDAQKYADILAEETQKMRESGALKKILDRYGVKDWKK